MRKHSSERGVIRAPKIAPHLRVNTVAINPAVPAQQSLLVTSEYDPSYGRVYPAGDAARELLAMIDGRRDAAQLIRDATAKTRRPHHEIAQLLQVFARAGIIISAHYRMHDGDAAAWLQRGFTPALVEDKLARARVTVVDLAAEAAAAAALHAALVEVGVATVNLADFAGDAGDSSVGDGEVVVTVVDDYLQESLAPINRDYLRRGIRWLPVKLSGGVQWAGPVFNDDGDNHRDNRPFMALDFCWHCLAQRILANRQIEQSARRQVGIQPSPPAAAGAAMLQTGARLIALEIAQYLLTVADDANGDATKTADDSLTASLFVFDQVANQTGRHRVNKNPACEVCVDQKDATPHGFAAVELDDPEPGLRFAGGWRSVAPDVTFANYRHLNNAFTGVVAHLESVPNPGDDNCFVFESDNNIATRSDNLFLALSSVQMRNAGKGTTPAQARAGALCEAIERYCASLHGDEARRRARYIDFRDGDALMPNRFMNLSEKQFAARAQLNLDALGNPFVNIPAPLAEDEVCEWSPLWSVTHRAIRWAPTQSLYYGYPYAGHWIAIPDTNGVAAATRARKRSCMHSSKCWSAMR